MSEVDKFVQKYINCEYSLEELERIPRPLLDAGNEMLDDLAWSHHLDSPDEFNPYEEPSEALELTIQLFDKSNKMQTAEFISTLKYAGEDNWGRDVYKKEKEHYVLVDGVLHSTSKDGEPESPIYINKEKVKIEKV